MKSLKPKLVLDIGKGFGKYGFLIHEYVGIDNAKKLHPSKTMAEQSSIIVDAVEADEDLMMPHLSHFYREVYFGDIFNLYKQLPTYDCILMIDVIEHLDKQGAIQMLGYFLQHTPYILIATPVDFFKQALYESEYEHHISHWNKNDFAKLGYVESMVLDGGAIYLLSHNPISIRGFGNSIMAKLRRIGRAFKNEMR